MTKLMKNIKAHSKWAYDLIEEENGEISLVLVEVDDPSNFTHVLAIVDGIVEIVPYVNPTAANVVGLQLDAAGCACVRIE
jgi:hypothetical protein